MRHIGSAGPGLLWRLYAGYKKSTKQVRHYKNINYLNEIDKIKIKYKKF